MAHCRRGKIPDEIDGAARTLQRLIHEKRLKIAVKSWRLQVPVDHQDSAPIAGQNPGRVRQPQRPAVSALVGVERDDLPLSRLLARANRQGVLPLYKVPRMGRSVTESP